jgi:predicted DNA-binding transcriptional regulator
VQVGGVRHHVLLFHDVQGLLVYVHRAQLVYVRHLHGVLLVVRHGAQVRGWLGQVLVAQQQPLKLIQKIE